MINPLKWHNRWGQNGDCALINRIMQQSHEGDRWQSNVNKVVALSQGEEVILHDRFVISASRLIPNNPTTYVDMESSMADDFVLQKLAF